MKGNLWKAGDKIYTTWPFISQLLVGEQRLCHSGSGSCYAVRHARELVAVQNWKMVLMRGIEIRCTSLNKSKAMFLEMGEFGWSVGFLHLLAKCMQLFHRDQVEVAVAYEQSCSQ